MPVVRVPLDRISDRESFHTVFAEVLGFPQWYGRNMDAWSDCLTRVDEPESGLTKVVMEPGDILTLELDGVKEFISRCPAQYRDLLECAAFVNYRRLKVGERSILALAFNA